MSSRRRYWEDRHRQTPDIRAVGHSGKPVGLNQAEYRVARKLLNRLLQEDGAKGSRVFDVGYGQGHDARICAQIGVAVYHGIDFAAPLPVVEDRPDFIFQQADAACPLVNLPDTAYDFVLLIDVAYHVVEDEEFTTLLANVRSVTESGSRIYLTGLFHDWRDNRHEVPWVRHRPLSAFRSLGVVHDIHPWRDVLLARIVGR